VLRGKLSFVKFCEVLREYGLMLQQFLSLFFWLQCRKIIKKF
jgi:hypothetical protein